MDPACSPCTAVAAQRGPGLGFQLDYLCAGGRAETYGAGDQVGATAGAASAEGCE